MLLRSGLPLCLFALLIGLMGKLSHGEQGSPSCYVRVTLSSDANRQEVLEALRKFGFVWDGRASAPGELWGHLLPDKIQSAEKIPGVRRLILEPEPVPLNPPERYQVWLRVALPADSRSPSARYVQYQALLKQLTALGFAPAPQKPEEWRYVDILRGEIPSKAVASVIDHPWVRCLLLVPMGVNLVDNAKELLFVEIWLGSNLSYEDQQLVWREARDRLSKVGFQPVTASNNDYGIRTIGWLPAASLFDLLESKHEFVITGGSGSSEFKPSALPLFRVIEVMGEPGKVEVPKFPSPQLGWPETVTPESKLSSAVAAWLGGAGEKQRMRLEIVFREGRDARHTVARLQQIAPSAEVEGSLGAIVWARLAPKEVTEIAKLPDVSTVRSPQGIYDAGVRIRLGSEWRYVLPGRPLQQYSTLLPLLSEREHLRVAIIGVDFSGWERGRGKFLPQATYYLDYTRWMNENLEPEPTAQVSDGALAVVENISQLSGAEEVYLVRVHESAPYQVVELLERISELAGTPLLVRRRYDELSALRSTLETEERELRLNKAGLLSRFREDDPEYWKARDNYLMQEKALQSRRLHYNELLYRLHELQNGLERLKRANVVIIVPQWRDGYPSVTHNVANLRWLPSAVRGGKAVIQVVTDWTEQDWLGWLRDVNGNEAVEFGEEKLPRWVEWNGTVWQQRHGVRAHRWGDAELNWLGWRPRQTALPPPLKGTTGAVFAELPPDMTIELVLQWKEVHDRRWANDEADPYRRPLTPWVIEVLQPVGFAGKVVPEDVYSLVAHSQGLPQRVEQDSRYGIYEMRLRFQTGKAPGRYAVRLRGRAPASTSPGGVPQLYPEQQEVWFRLSAEVIDEGHRSQGRLVWITPSTR